LAIPDLTAYFFVPSWAIAPQTIVSISASVNNFFILIYGFQIFTKVIYLFGIQMLKRTNKGGVANLATVAEMATLKRRNIGETKTFLKNKSPKSHVAYRK